MKKMLFAVIMMSFALALAGCGSGSSSPPTLTTQILSNPTYDGDIELDQSNVYTVTQGNVPSVFAGIDPSTLSEYRAFLDFPLTGAVPVDAFIASATLDIFINSIAKLPVANSIPIRIELVSFSPPTLLTSDFNRSDQPPLEYTTIIPPISPNDVQRHVAIDVTPLMVEAQRRGLANFQIRILEDDGFVYPGLIEIDDTTTSRAPLLEVSYY
ncbi:MAG: hypothetical protein PHH28_06605 [Desulfuromonadaceae bacterium]|nr:hypothetical protein [Desulfuromonadaceae bacterium]